MLKVFLFLSVFTGGQWEPLSNAPMDSIEACMSAAQQVLTKLRDAQPAVLDDMVPAFGAECRIGIVQGQ